MSKPVSCVSITSCAITALVLSSCASTVTSEPAQRQPDPQPQANSVQPAQPVERAPAVIQKVVRDDSALPPTQEAFLRFTPSPDIVETRIDYSIWTDALRSFVFNMGASIRRKAPWVRAGVGTNIVYGHDSPYRLEGNRVRFSYLNDDVLRSLTEYRMELESLPDQVELTRLSRNEQLAYWLNLHNVATIEKIALAYPLSQPSRQKIVVDGQEWPFDTAPFLNVNGVSMSLEDIRTQIIYPNWKNPKVIYGLFRGDIGGPSIQREAFDGSNVNRLLNRSATEFVNSLRGVQEQSKGILVSEIYDEARPYYFQTWPNDLIIHLRQFAKDDVQEILSNNANVFAEVYEKDIADLAKGERDPNISNVTVTDGSGTTSKAFGPPPEVARLLNEFRQKVEVLRKRNGSAGTVRIIDLPDSPQEAEEID